MPWRSAVMTGVEKVSKELLWATTMQGYLVKFTGVR